MYAKKSEIPIYNNTIRLFDKDGNRLYKINWKSTDNETISSHITGLEMYRADKIQYNEGRIYELLELRQVLKKHGNITIKELKQIKGDICLK